MTKKQKPPVVAFSDGDAHTTYKSLWGEERDKFVWECLANGKAHPLSDAF